MIFHWLNCTIILQNVISDPHAIRVQYHSHSKDHNIQNTQRYTGERRYSSTLSWTWHYMEVCGQLPALATLNPEWDLPYIHWTGRLLVPTLTLDALRKRKISSPCQASNLDSSIDHHVAYLLYWPHNLSSQKIQRNTTIHILLHSGKVRNNWLFFIIWLSQFDISFSSSNLVNYPACAWL
jgi:hypothetical protein